MFVCLDCSVDQRIGVHIGVAARQLGNQMRLEPFLVECVRSLMAYAAVTSLMETLSLNFLQSQPPFPLEDLAAQMRDDANEHLGFLQQIVEPKIREMELDEAASSKCWIKLHGIFNNGAVKQSDYTKKKKLIKSEKQQLLAECSSQNERITNWLRKVGEVKQKIVSLHQNLGFLQQSLEKSEIPFDDAVMKDLEAQIRDASFKAEQRIEMELSAIYLAKESLLHVTACLLSCYSGAEFGLFSHMKLLRVVDIEGDDFDGRMALNVLANLVHLRYLALSTCRTFEVKLFENWNMQSFVVRGDDSFYNFENLKQLEKLSIRRCQRLIEGNIPWATNLLPNIKRLNLLGSMMWWSSLSLISMFPNLEVLKVINSCVGKKWELSDEVFPRLKRLVIKNANLEYWNAVGDHFPVLECLELSNCHWLEEIPRGFADITTLALIQLRKCKDSVVASAKWIQEEQNNNYGNDVLVRSEDIMRSEIQMAYAAVTSLMETLSLNFLQSQPPFPLEDLAAQVRDDANENLGLLQQILEAEMRKMELDEASSKGWRKQRLPRIKACLPRLYGNKQLAWDTVLLTSRLREVVEVKQKIVSLHQNLGLLQQSLEKSEIACHDAEMKHLEAQIRDASFKAEERIEMELTTIYLAKGMMRLRKTACLLRLHEIFNEAEKQTDYHRNELIRIQTEYQQLAKVSLLGRIRRRGLLQLVKGSSLPDLLEKLSIKRWVGVNLVMCSIPWATSLPNLKKLSFFESNLQWHELNAISMLPNLEVLKLIDACEGSKWETCYGGFHRLKRLVIRKTNLQYWNAVGDHFPMLECLEISDCSRLKEIPRDFADITTLALIQLSNCKDSLVASAKWIQEEQSNNYGNDALLVRH
nr:putative late blight resistance protein homolog R1B-14 isoform X3 [Ipomoea trifida]